MRGEAERGGEEDRSFFSSLRLMNDDWSLLSLLAVTVTLNRKLKVVMSIRLFLLRLEDGRRGQREETTRSVIGSDGADPSFGRWGSVKED
jgi:hypothetical protein